MLVCPKDLLPVEDCKGVVYSIHCGECLNVYIGQTERCLKQRVLAHWCAALKNGDIQASAPAEHVFTTGNAVDLSQSEVLDHHHHHHTLHVGELAHPAEPGSLEKRVRNPTEMHAALLDWGTCTYIHWYHTIIYLQCIGFVSTENNLTQHKCVCVGVMRMCRQHSWTDGHGRMCTVLGQIILFLSIFIFLTVLYSIVFVYILYCLVKIVCGRKFLWKS